jgi:tetratricopeptide (TPR) repeat protein
MPSFARLSATAILLIALLPLEYCDSGPDRVVTRPTKPMKQPPAPSWEREAARLLESGDCIAVRRYLEQRTAREPLWYELMSQAHITCWRESGSAADFDSAIGTLDAGLLAFPRSANLLLSKGYRHLEVGDVDLANKYFRAAEARASENLKNDSLAARSADEATAKAAAKALAERIDPSVMQRRFEQKILQLVAAGDCAGGIRELRAAPIQRQSDGWFHLLYVSNHTCFVETGDAAYERSAQVALTEGLRSFPSSPRLLLEAAALREEKQDFKVALELYQAALDSPEFDNNFVDGRAAIEQRVRNLKAKIE